MQYSLKTLSALAAAGVASAMPFSSSFGARSSSTVAKRDFNAAGGNNVAVWWGNSNDTPKFGLDKACADDAYDIVILTFGIGIDPATGVNVAGGAADKSLASTIKTCQSNGKKVFMSIGGATGQIKFGSDDEASKAADTVAAAFLQDGPQNYYGVTLDGIDLDNETGASAHWQAFVSQLRTHTSSSQYISGAPQCPFPDQSLDTSTLNEMDFVWVQFYNNPPCMHGSAGFMDSVKQWSSALTKPKLYIGAAGDSGSAPAGGYIDPVAMAAEVAAVQALGLSNVGGYALWDASTAQDNGDFGAVIKKALGAAGSVASPPSSPSKPSDSPSPTPTAIVKGQDGGDGTVTVGATSTAVVTSTTFLPGPAPTPSGPETVHDPTDGNGNGAPAAAGTQSCSSPASIVCSSDGKQFGICDGTSAFMQSVSAGTVCQNGSIVAASS